MPASIHPYKGYLNTTFRIYATGNSPIGYKVLDKANKNHSKSIYQGIVLPNDPHEIKLPYTGLFEIEFDNGSHDEIIVEDGYKYGGNKLKTAFIFDNCPWAFVVMHDRTYFYNRENGESYVEVVSPDNILEISNNFVLFENKDQDDVVSLYSLIDQKPILWIKNVQFYNSEVLCWSNGHEEETNLRILNIYSLDNKKKVHRIFCENYIFDNQCQFLYYQASKSIYKLELQSNAQPICVLQNIDGFVSFFEKHYVVLYNHDYTSLLIYDLSSSLLIGEIPLEGKLARVNDKQIINVWSKYNEYKDFDFNSIKLSEATISCTYTELDIYPCCWGKLFYTQKTTYISSHRGLLHNSTTKEEKSYLKSLESNYVQELHEIQGEICITDRYFLFYNSKESIVIPRHYSKWIKYIDKGIVHKFKNMFVLLYEGTYHILSRNGFWDKTDLYSGDLDFSNFELFGVVTKEKDKLCYLYDGTYLGQYRFKSNHQRIDYLFIDDYRVYEGGIKVLAKDCPEYVSRLVKHGISVNKTGVYCGLFNEDKKFTTQQILKDIYDTSEYMNVLLEESGKQIICRDNETSFILDLETGEKTEFANLSYINHINGIRPFVRIRETSQAILINPVDGQPIDYKLQTEYQFVSPDRHLYADKVLEKYIEYYNRLSGELITKNTLNQLLDDFTCPVGAGEETKETIKQNRLSFVNLHYDFLLHRLKEKWPGYGIISKKDVIERLTGDGFKGNEFVNLFIEKRGVAVIKRISDNSEVARIALGVPLWFLNYVAFSKNNDYVAIAGRYPNESNVGGLFLVYDLKNQKEIVRTTNTYAVWTVAFNQDNAVAAYTAYGNDPSSFFASCPNDYKNAASDGFNIDHYNFLTFSPDGKLLACSQQGYIPYRKQNGQIRENWGHQPSSLVSIRLSQNPFVELLAFHDLSEMGIADTMKAKSVASVSFSNDNSRIMMVGKDGTVIVRNLHFNETDKIDERHDKHNDDEAHETYGTSYGEYAGTYAQDVMGFSDDVINDAFEGDPDACLNID